MSVNSCILLTAFWPLQWIIPLAAAEFTPRQALCLRWSRHFLAGWTGGFDWDEWAGGLMTSHLCNIWWGEDKSFSPRLSTSFSFLCYLLICLFSLDTLLRPRALRLWLLFYLLLSSSFFLMALILTCSFHFLSGFFFFFSALLCWDLINFSVAVTSIPTPGQLI